MPLDISTLPTKIPELHNIIVLYSKKLEESNAELEEANTELEEANSELEEVNSELKESHIENENWSKKSEEQVEIIIKLTEKVKLLRKLRYAHKSEKWTNQDKKQALLFDEAEAESPHPSDPVARQKITVKQYSRKKPGRKALDPKLPRKTIEHDLTDAEKKCKCGHDLKKVGEDHREELDFQPAKYYVNHHIYPKYACEHCNHGEKVTDEADKSAPEVKSAPKNALIPKSFASPGLLAYLLVSKFEDHLPFYRMERVFSRLRVTLPRATMCNWAVNIGERLKPILEVMQEDMMSSKLIAADETPLQVMKEPGRKNTAKSYMWLFRGETEGNPILVYQYHPTRSGKVASGFLSGYSGSLISDGYAGYNEPGSRPEIIHAGCWAHARRKFKEADDMTSTENTRKALSLIQSLYLIEKKIREESLGLDKILALRQKMSKPIVEDFKHFLVNLHVPPESLLGKAIGYALGQWDKLLVFLEVPYVPIDNNRIENDIRPFVLGRKNWLFAGSPRGAYASCAIYSLIQTARANGLDPYLYLRWLFEQLKDIKDESMSADKWAELAPHRVTKSTLEAYAKTLA